MLISGLINIVKIFAKWYTGYTLNAFLNTIQAFFFSMFLI